METKREFRYFTIMEYEKEQLYLQQKHKEGWKFVNVTGFGLYHFEKCEPEDVVYQLDYNKEGLAHKGEYVQLFKDCGWEYLTDYVGYSYFRKPANQMNTQEEIFCDDASRLEMMQRVFKGRLTPLLIIFCSLILQFCSHLHSNNSDDNFIIYMIGAVLILYLIIFADFGIKYIGYKNKIKR